MTKRPRRNHSPAFKALLSKGEKTLLSSEARCNPRCRFDIGLVDQDLSDCLFRQVFWGCHGRLSRRIALRIVRSFRATAIMASFFGLPSATSRLRKALSV
jgi:hypothetical protein